jgi:hypothetical protein
MVQMSSFLLFLEISKESNLLRIFDMFTAKQKIVPIFSSSPVRNIYAEEGFLEEEKKVYLAFCSDSDSVVSDTIIPLSFFKSESNLRLCLLPHSNPFSCFAVQRDCAAFGGFNGIDLYKRKKSNLVLKNSLKVPEARVPYALHFYYHSLFICAENTLYSIDYEEFTDATMKECKKFATTLHHITIDFETNTMYLLTDLYVYRVHSAFMKD